MFWQKFQQDNIAYLGYGNNKNTQNFLKTNLSITISKYVIKRRITSSK